MKYYAVIVRSGWVEIIEFSKREKADSYVTEAIRRKGEIILRVGVLKGSLIDWLREDE